MDMKTKKPGILITAAFILSTFPAIAENSPDIYKRADDLVKKQLIRFFTEMCGRYGSEKLTVSFMKISHLPELNT